jgi:hypothetical protein
MLFHGIDSAFLLATSFLLVALGIRDYGSASFWTKASLFAIAIFAFFEAMHLLGMSGMSRGPFWARIGLDASVAFGVARRYFFEHFAPRPATSHWYTPRFR